MSRTHDTSLLRARIKHLAELQHDIKRAYAADHTAPEHAAVVAKWPSRQMHAAELTACHIVLAGLRGKTHCDSAAWLKSLWYAPRLVADAEKLVVCRALLAS